MPANQQVNRRQFLRQASAAFSAAGLSPVLWSCQPSLKKRPNILWITCEDISPALGCYGDSYARTPHLDTLGNEGILYRNAYATAPICAPARSCLISGIAATTLGTQHLRSDIPMPKDFEILPQILKRHGYFCSNNSKTDYNFDASGRWDENSNKAHWRNRPNDIPFFSVFNFTVSHEGHGNNLKDSAVQDLKVLHDPDKAKLPPYFPDTPQMQKIWAHYYDMVTVMDKQVGALLQDLEADGLRDNTIIFFTADHGFGLPRYKRWPYHTGLHVPLIIWMPESYRNLAKTAHGDENADLINFCDFAPTVLHLADIDVPERMQGTAFLGQAASQPREFMVAARSRADDVYDVCRTVRDQRYLYIRNYMPHRPYIQKAIIFSDRKSSFAELHKMHDHGELPPAGRAMFEPKPREELYDLQNDPDELHNLADHPDQHDKIQQMHQRLRDWILQTRDTGFLNEADMMIRAEGSSVYDMAQDASQYDLERILNSAELVGDNSISMSTLAKALKDEDSGVRYWAAVAILARGTEGHAVLTDLQKALNDTSPSVRITAAEALCHLDSCSQALAVLKSDVQDQERLTVALHAAIAIRHIGSKAEPLVPVIYDMLHIHSGNVWGRYKNWMYPMFIGMALDQALLNCNKPLPSPINN